MFKELELRYKGGRKGLSSRVFEYSEKNRCNTLFPSHIFMFKCGPIPKFFEYSFDLCGLKNIIPGG